MNIAAPSVRRILIAFGATSFLIAALFALAPSGSGASADSAIFTKSALSQKGIASSKKVSVTVNSSKTDPSVSIGISRGGSTTALTAGQTVTLSGGTATVKIPLTTAGKTEIAKCGAAKLVVSLNGSYIGSAGEGLLYVDSSTCKSQAPVVDTGTASRCDVTDPADCMFPFPNDYFTKVDRTKSSGRRLNFNLDSMPHSAPSVHHGIGIAVDGFNKFDGFSPGSTMLTHIPGLTNQAAFNASGLVPVTDIGRYADTNQAAVVIDTATGQRWPIWSELSTGYTDESLDGVASTPEANLNVMIHPAKNFLDGHHYVVALRNLKDSSGASIQATNGFRIYRDRLVTSSSVIESRRAHMEDLFTQLKTAGIDRSSLNIAWDFTVASTKSLSERLLKLRNDGFAKLGDTSMGDNVIQGRSPVWHVTSTDETPSDPDTLRTVYGTIEVPCYLTSVGCAPGGTFKTGSNGLPKQNGSSIQLARFRCDVPQSAVDGSGAMYMTLYGHGLFGTINEIGSRNVRQFANENRMLVCGTDWSGMADEDQYPATGVLSNLGLFPQIADRLQQGYLNFMYLGRAMAHPQGLTTDPAFHVTSGGKSSSYHTGYIAYYGNSQGGIAGGGLTAISPDVTRSVLYVGAMNYSLLLTRSVDFDEFKPFLYPSYPNLTERPLLLDLIQIMWDRGEPDGYANHITSNPLPDTPAKHVTMEMSFGDHQVSNIATLVEARTLGLKIRQPFLDATRDTNGAVTPWGLSVLGSMPLDDNALIPWDIGPFRSPDAPNCKTHSGDNFCGTPSPPADNSPNRIGTDPHDLNIDSMASLRKQIGDYIKPGGRLNDVCSGLPCYGAGWTGLSN
jgi:hypothetical protein